MCVCVLHTAYFFYYCEHGGVDLMELSSFSALMLLVDP